MGPRERNRRRRAKRHIVPTVLLSLLGFLLIAGVAFGVGMVGNVTRWLSDLPDYTDANAYLVSEPTEIVDCNGNKLASFYTQNRKSVTKDNVSPYVLQGTVDVEDERFYEHGGIDLWGIARAAVATLSGGHEGASTITQQLVRNTILSEEQFDSTIERKVREAYIAVKMEEVYSKDDILMMYLNTIYYGHGAYGIEAAAETYLSKSAKDLTLSEAALLIGLPNSPSQYDPTVNPDLALSRRNKVLDNMLRLGHITQEEHDAAQAEPIQLNVTEISGSGVEVYSQPYFVAYVKQLLEQEFSTDVLFKGGLTVKTTIDPTMQQVAESAVKERLDILNLDGLDMGMVVVDPKTGYIKCMVGGYDYNADDQHVNHATAKRPVGSTFKAFTLATAIQNGMNPDITVNCASPLTLKNSSNTKVENYGNESYGYISLKQATAYSSNTGYVQVAEAVGNQKIISLVKKLGIDTAKDNIEDVPVMTLGTGSISPLEMASAYATFANGGDYRQPIAITEIDSRTGSVLYQHTDNPTQVLTSGEAAAVTDVLSGVLKGQGTGVAGALSVDQPVAGKTGTTDDTTNLWFCGYTPQLSVAMWTGYTAGEIPIQKWGQDLLGDQTNLPVFKKFMDTVLAGQAREEFPTGTAPTYKNNSEWKFSNTSSSANKYSSSKSSSTGSSSNSSSIDSNTYGNGYSTNNNYGNSTTETTGNGTSTGTGTATPSTDGTTGGGTSGGEGGDAGGTGGESGTTE